MAQCRRLVWFAGALLAASAARDRAAAEPAVAAATPEQGGVQAPRLLAPVQAIYPEAARTEHIEADVVLRLSIDVEGRVTQAELVTAAGHGLDEAARDAVLRARFAPAMRDGQALPARILYRHEFRLPADRAPVAAPVAAPAPASPVPVEVQVRARPSEAQRMRRSAEAVSVVETAGASRARGDLGEWIARTPGVSLRRAGSLGADSRFELGGLHDDQIRFTLDGVPLQAAGYPLGIANVPLDLIERVEVYRGVVPIRLGADALGGAVNLVTWQDPGQGARASYEVGSFGTHRATVRGGVHDHGWLARASAFGDLVQNDYDVDVEVPDPLGRLSPARVRRFHDRYRAYGASLEAGVAGRPWADRLTLRGFTSGYDKQLQHNPVMTVPYGEVVYGERDLGATARYQQPLTPALRLDVALSYVHRELWFRDQARHVYDWFGRRGRERLIGGELQPNPTDQHNWQHNGFARATLGWTLAASHALRASVSGEGAMRHGRDELATPGVRDPLQARRRVLSVVSGVEYEWNAGTADRLQNIVLAKHYLYQAHGQEPQAGGAVFDLEHTTQRLGAGDSLRIRIGEALFVKASYEYATRLPRQDEIFGDGVLVEPNLELAPETSHNANLGLLVSALRGAVGQLDCELNGFLRSSDRLIVLLGNDRYFMYENVYRARAIGLEGSMRWTVPGRFLTLDANATWQDVRNRSGHGSFADFDGDRIPNRPWLFASWGVRGRVADLLWAGDELEPYYEARYVRGFYRSWESLGLRAFKQAVPSQLVHSAGVSYAWRRGSAAWSASFELQNLFSATAYDFYGVQRPPRGGFLKFTAEL